MFDQKSVVRRHLAEVLLHPVHGQSDHPVAAQYVA